MLDQTTKRKIDSARNILVGKVPDPKAQVEQITTALIYKFMDDMDKESEELGGKADFFSNGFEKYSWTKLMDKRLSGQERLDLYVQAITNLSKNPHIPQLFRDIFKDAFLPYRDFETLSLFLKEIDGFSYEHSENLGDAFEYLLAVLGSQGNAGQFRTPRHIIDFIVEVVDPKKNENILDPACGTAGFLISAYKHIIKHNSSSYKPTKEKIEEKIKEGETAAETVLEEKASYTGDKLSPDEKATVMKNVAGYDISPDMVKLSLVNLYLHGFSNPVVHEYDTLTSEKRWNESFDVIMANPPFMTPTGGIRPHKRFQVQANRSEVLFVDYILEHLNLNGRAGIIVPEGIIFQNANAYKQLRKLLIEDGLFAVVSLPPGVFNPYSGVKTSILFFDNQLAKKTDEILFVKVANDGFDLGAQRRKINKNDLPEALSVLDACKRGEKKESDLVILASKEKITESGDYSLTGDRYAEKIGFKTKKWPLVDLGTLFEKSKDQINPKGKSGETVYVGLENIQSKTGCLVGSVKDDVANIKSLKNVFKNGEILYGKLRPNLNKVWLADREGICSTDIFVLRKKNSSVNEALYALILRSGIFNEEVLKGVKGAQLPRVGYEHLAAIKVPHPPREVQNEIVEQIEVKQKAIDHAKEVIKNLESDRRYFGRSLRKLDDIEWVQLGENCKTTSGGTPLKNKKEYYENGSIPWLKSGEVNQGVIYQVEEKITELGMKNSSAKLFPKDTVLVAMYGATAGKVGLLKIKSTTNQAICGILPNDKFVPKFLYLFLNTMTDAMVKLSGGGAQPNISQKIIRELKVPCPSIETQKELVTEAGKEEEIIAANQKLIHLMKKKISIVLSDI